MYTCKNLITIYEASQLITRPNGFRVNINLGYIYLQLQKGQGTADSIPNNENIGNAKTWYNQKFPLKSSAQTRSLSTTIQNSDHDLTQVLQPDWEHAEVFKRDTTTI